ncbi:DUF4142 domain-containing protein [Pseudomonas capeferrum]|uniref:DUF4142 domain-containing protein n=1 Tax=Pseudomonas capeferrum TaxID=1495066 RepID=UPI0015E32248|nr:DUF4142 domain-containing protein [Pseudomonas capeferrum]MBA1204116.1 DUF4142 domain-containing protein [Pseudomonas capeferrum]
MNHPTLKQLSLAIVLGMGAMQGAWAATSDDFVDAAAESGIAEVETGKLALQKSQSADIKKFAQQMVDEHSKANEELKGIATKLEITPPDEAALIDKAKKVILEWRDESFDKSYVNNQVDAHQKAVALFEKEANSSDKAELKAFAAKTLPHLQEHLKEAQALQSTHGK